MYYSTGDVQYLNATQAGADHLLGTLSEEKSTGFYSGISGSGTAGTGLFLIYAYKETGDRWLLNLAELAGKRLIELGEMVENGMKWAMNPNFPRYMPNFSHGTAGIVYFFCTGIQISARSVAGSMSGEGMLRYFSSTGPACS